MKFKEYLEERKYRVAKDFSSVIGGKIKDVVNDDAGLVLFVKKDRICAATAAGTMPQPATSCADAFEIATAEPNCSKSLLKRRAPTSGTMLRRMRAIFSSE